MVNEARRIELPYKNNSLQYLLNETDFSDDCFRRQYNIMYRVRLGALYGRVLRNAKHILGDKIQQTRIDALRFGKSALIIGTVEKRMENRAGVLKVLASDEHLTDDIEAEGDGGGVAGDGAGGSGGGEKRSNRNTFITKSDFIELEDESQIIRISESVKMDEVSTGVIVGFYGKQTPENTFDVERIIWPAAAPQAPLPSTLPPATIAFISGLNLSGSATRDSRTVLALSLFTRWLSGHSVSEEQQKRATRVERVVIVGSSIAHQDPARDMSSMVTSLIRQDIETDKAALATLDHCVAPLARATWLDIVAGVGDCCTQMLPQQPIGRVSMPTAADAHGLRLHTNPYECNLAGVDFMMCAGQNVSDIRRQTSLSSCDVCAFLLRASHIAPTCPDTVDGFPFEARDPLIIERTFPHVFVAGNQSGASSARMEEFEDGDGSKRKCLLLSISKFSETNTVTFLDLQTMQVSYEFFGT